MIRRRRPHRMLKIGLAGLVATCLLLFSDFLPWALDLIGEPQAIGFLDSLLMPAVMMFVVLSIWGLVETFGR